MLPIKELLIKGVSLTIICAPLLLGACGNKTEAPTEAPAAAPETKQENAAPATAAPAAPVATGSSKFDLMLDSYEKIVVEYEAVANKDPICTDDMMNLVTNVTPKLTAMASDLQEIQTAGGDAPSPSSMNRYMALTQRYSKVAEQFSKKAGTPSGC